jgi:hypothetical protein
VIPGAEGNANAGDISIPQSLQAAITAVEPHARIITRADVDWKSCGSPEVDQIVHADLNGDGLADYAALLFLPKKRSRTAGTVWLVVFLGRRDGSYKPIVLDRHGNQPSTGLVDINIAARPTGVVAEAPSGRQISLTLPAVERVWCERSSTIFFWNDKARRFESVWTAD